MRVCFFAEDASPLAILAGEATSRGGAEKQVGLLMAGLRRAGHDVSLLHCGPHPAAATPSVATLPGGASPDGAGIEVVGLDLDWRHAWRAAALWRALSGVGPDAIYTRLPHDFAIVNALFAKRRAAGTTFLYGLANDLFCSPRQAYTYRRWFHGPLYAASLHGASRILVQHDGQRGLLARRLRRRCSLVPNIVALPDEPRRPYGASDFDAVWVGHFRPEKRLDRFLDVAEAHPALRCAVVGDFRPDAEEVERARLTARLGRLANVSWPGLLAPAATVDWIRRSRVLVNTSLNEGFPNTMLEAWALGVPVASYSVDPGGVIAGHGLGLVGGSPAGLADAVCHLALDEERNTTVGARGRAFVIEHHGEQSVIARFERAVGEAGRR